MLNQPSTPVVLVVEDDYYNMRLVTDLLRHHGFYVVQSFNGNNLLELCATCRPSIILMDISLKGTDGISLTKTVKSHETNRSIPIIALTAHATVQTEQTILAAGCAGIILKPINTRTFPEQVKHYIEFNQGEQQDDAR